MKKLNLFSNLWSSLVGSRKDNGSTRLRVVFDSFTCRLRVWHVISSRMAAVFLLLLTLGVGKARATVVTSTFTNSSMGVGTGEPTWSSSTTPTAFESDGNKRGVSWSKASTTLTNTSLSSYSISQVDVVTSANGSGGTITVTVGGNSFSSTSTSISSGDVNVSHSFTGTATTGNIEIGLPAGGKSIWVKSISVTYSSCGGTKLGTPVVTATPSSGKVALTWPDVSNASGYQLNWNGGGWASASSGIEKTGLTDGTTYTYQVKAIGDGDDYCDGDASASASVVPGTYYTVTWNAAGSSPQTTSVRSGTKPTFPSTPSSCDATSTAFYGWATATWSGTLDDVSAKTIYTSASDMPNVTGSGVNYYAVFAKSSASGDYVKGTKSDLTDGQTVMIVNSYNSAALSSEDDSDYDEFYRDGVDVSISSNKISSPASALIWTVELGENSGYYFKHGDNYINVTYSSSNYYLFYDDDTDEWQVSGSGPYVLTSGNASSYKLWYDDEDGLFDVYTGSGNAYNVDFYIPEITYSKYLTTCCDKAITVGSPTITGEGTIVFTPSTSPIATCDDDVEIVARVTPASGYECTALSFTGGSVSVSPAIASNKPAYPSYQDFTLSFAQNTNATLTTSATFSAKGVTGWTWKQQLADASEITIPATVNLYVGQQAKFLLKEYVPSDVISGNKGYSADYTNADLAQDNKAGAYYVTRAKQVKASTTLTLTSSNNSSVTEVITIKISALPSVSFVDNVHNEAFSTVTATIDADDKRIVYTTKHTPTHSDFSGSTANTCEETHLHLVGWIDGAWEDYEAYMDGTGSKPSNTDITGATGYFYAPNADIDLVAKNGHTFYAVWAKVE